MTESGAFRGINDGSIVGTDDDEVGAAESVPPGAHPETPNAITAAKRMALTLRMCLGYSPANEKPRDTLGAPRGSSV